MSKLDNATSSRIESEHTKVDVVACIASFVYALACLIFLLWQTKLTNVGRSYIECIVDPVTCLIAIGASIDVFTTLRQFWPT